ncbi:MarR family winged helix-turn-helix transcriptional regulator [Marinobacterium sp. YM272]|uniref:MarR family winged helix-turn-helix transcriptional regulator n=1 Tax=Marinobacterium sp. YM272 TaxID=3421654 RepID=UPI003D7F1B7B
MALKESQSGEKALSSSTNSTDSLAILNGALGYAIKRAQVYAYDLFYKSFGQDAISPARLTALTLISKNAGITQSDLAKKLDISRAGIVKVIDRLEEMNLIERRAKKGDRRSYSLHLTEPGQDELAFLTEQTLKYEALLASNLSDTERKQLIALLEKMISAEASPQI